MKTLSTLAVTALMLNALPAAATPIGSAILSPAAATWDQGSLTVVRHGRGQDDAGIERRIGGHDDGATHAKRGRGRDDAGRDDHGGKGRGRDDAAGDDRGGKGKGRDDAAGDDRGGRGGRGRGRD